MDSIYCNLSNHLTEENIPICLSISWWARLSNGQLTAGYLVIEKLQTHNKDWQLGRETLGLTHTSLSSTGHDRCKCSIFAVCKTAQMVHTT